MIQELARDEVVSVIEEAVTELLERADCRAPPVDAVALAQTHLGMTICLDSRLPNRGRARRTARDRLIYLRPEPRLERRQWAVAHEIGEHLVPELLRRLKLEPESIGRMSGESLANLFAVRLLAPTVWLARDARALGYELPALKERYATASHEVLAGRLLDLPEPCIVTIVDNGHVSRRRSNAWPVTRALSAAERECQEYVHYYSRPRRVREEAWTVQGWPLHEPDWKREILRSVVDE